MKNFFGLNQKNQACTHFSVQMVSNQGEYKKNGVVIKEATGLQYGHVYILPYFTKKNENSLVEGKHFFRSLKDLQSAYPNAEVVKSVTESSSKLFPVSTTEVTQEGSKRKRKISSKFREAKEDNEEVRKSSKKDEVGSKNSKVIERIVSKTLNVGKSYETVCHVCSNVTSGAHECVVCKRKVHMICGEGTGQEGYGQKVTCNNCIPQAHSTEKEVITKTIEFHDTAQQATEVSPTVLNASPNAGMFTDVNDNQRE